eukprot:CAMPEP_0173461334 /NCGR_PEP_ID=MMETSP1357-20121228/64768_1 /TAXON_ID=77926 /ORGANISM="Hemiselmis rufescens, Strain PCC563" /LENGTH=33 /DNA_ID= /DNA_START= /DNA_END= /DNA_ORIENTATION=
MFPIASTPTCPPTVLDPYTASPSNIATHASTSP